MGEQRAHAGLPGLRHAAPQIPEGSGRWGQRCSADILQKPVPLGDAGVLALMSQTPELCRVLSVLLSDTNTLAVCAVLHAFIVFHL